MLGVQEGHVATTLAAIYLVDLYDGSLDLDAWSSWGRLTRCPPNIHLSPSS